MEGIVSKTAVMGDTAMDGLSDRGSIPLRSIKKSFILKGFGTSLALCQVS